MSLYAFGSDSAGTNVTGIKQGQSMSRVVCSDKNAEKALERQATWKETDIHSVVSINLLITEFSKTNQYRGPMAKYIWSGSLNQFSYTQIFITHTLKKRTTLQLLCTSRQTLHD